MRKKHYKEEIALEIEKQGCNCFRGIGRAIWELFAFHGARVAVNYSEEADRDYTDQKGIKLFNDKIISNYS